MSFSLFFLFPQNLLVASKHIWNNMSFFFFREFISGFQWKPRTSIIKCLLFFLFQRIYNRGFNSRGFSNPSLGSDPSSGGGKPFSKMNTSPLLGATPQATNNSFRSRNQAGIERGRGRGVPGSSYHTRPGIKDGSDLYNNTMNRNRFGVNSVGYME